MAEKLTYKPAGSQKSESAEAEDEENAEVEGEENAEGGGEEIAEVEDEEIAEVEDAEQQAEAGAFLGGYVQEEADGDVDLNVPAARQIREEAIRMQFDQGQAREGTQQAYQRGRELARAGEKINLDYEHENEIQEMVDRTDLADIPNTVQEATDFMFPEGEDISTSRLVVLLSYCYKLIKKVLRTEVGVGKVVVGEVIVGAVVIGAVAVILYQVFKRIDFFKWLVKQGGWAALRWVREFVDAGRSAISGWLNRPPVPMVGGARVSVAPCAAGATQAAVLSRSPVLSRSVLPLAARLIAPRMWPVAAGIALVGVVTYWWRRRSD